MSSSGRKGRGVKVGRLSRKAKPWISQDLTLLSHRPCREGCHPTCLTEAKAEVQNLLPKITQPGNWGRKLKREA